MIMELRENWEKCPANAGGNWEIDGEPLSVRYHVMMEKRG
jgi:hypothetical protein